MDIDLDTLEDIFAEEAVKKTRTVGKFQPKLKPRPPKKDSVATSVSSTVAAQTSDSAKSDTSKIVITAKPSENFDQSSSGLSSKVSTKDIAEATPHVHSNLEFVSNGNRDVEKSAGENTDIFVGLEALGDFLPPTTSEAESSAPPSKAVAFNILNPENAEGGLATPDFSTVTEPTHSPNVADVPTCPEPLADSDPLTSRETIMSRSEEGIWMNNQGLEREEIDVMDSVNMSELSTKSVPRSGKFQPKPKVQIQVNICAANGKSISDRPSSIPVQPEISSTENFSSFERGDVLDLSSIGFNHCVSNEGTSEVPLNEEFMDHINITQLDSSINLECVPEYPAKLASRRPKTGRKIALTVSDPSLQQQKASTSIQENETGRSLRPRRRKTGLHEWTEDEVPESREFSDEILAGSSIEEDSIDDEEFHAESESKMKKARKKSKRPHADAEKPDKKRRKAKEASDQGEDAKPKKFPHSTRRRRVDKVLLETPEDDIDFQKVPLRDLILLAEHKERQMKKEEAAAGKPGTKQSNGNSSACHNEDETFNSGQGGEFNDEQASPVVEECNMYFNYQTYMDKEPRARWSKQDTELFYEGVRQFGTDLSMIQHLFPGRTRRQVKLKYKKEERQHPLMLRDALTNRSKDHFHFNVVIDRLKQIAAEENLNADRDESVDLTGEEVVEEGNLNAGNEEAKNEHIEDPTNDDVIEADQSPAKHSYDIEDDLFDWSQY